MWLGKVMMEGVDSVCEGKQPVIKSAQYSVKVEKSIPTRLIPPTAAVKSDTKNLFCLLNTS